MISGGIAHAGNRTQNLARLLHHSKQGRRTLTFLGSYIDECGIDQGKDALTTAGYIFCSAGYVAPAEDWDRFSQRWCRVLLGEGLPDPPLFHMKNFARSEGDFVGWDNDRKEAVLSRLIAILEDTHALGHACLVARGRPEDWNGASGLILSRQYPGFLPHCAVQLARRADAFLMTEEKIGFIFGRNSQYGSMYLMAYEHLKDTEEFDRRNRLGAGALGDPRKHPPLQAADLLAWESRRGYIDFVNPAKSELRRSFLRLDKPGLLTRCVHSKETLEPVMKRVLTDPTYEEGLEAFWQKQAKKGYARPKPYPTHRKRRRRSGR